MPTAKLKNLTILILLLANLCLLAVIVPIQHQRQEQADNLNFYLSRLYAKEDLKLRPELIPETQTIYALQLVEDPAADLVAATTLLGEHVLVQDDSTRYLSQYNSVRGACSIGRDGSFDAVLTEPRTVDDAAKDSREVLRAMGFQPYYLGQPSRVDDRTQVVQASQAILGLPIFSQGLTLTYVDSALTGLRGTFYTGTASPIRVSEKACLSAADALVAFLSARFDLGWVGSEISSMEQGYLRTEVAAAAAINLMPVWRLGTDTGAFTINGLTGEVTSISG